MVIITTLPRIKYRPGNRFPRFICLNEESWKVSVYASGFLCLIWATHLFLDGFLNRMMLLSLPWENHLCTQFSLCTQPSLPVGWLWNRSALECLLAELYGRGNPSTREARGRRTWWCHSAFLRTNPFLLLHSEPWIPSAWASQYSLCFIWPGMASLTLTSFDWLDKWTVYGCPNSVLLCWACHCASQGLPPIPSHLSGCPWCSPVISFLRWVWDRERRPEGATEGRRGVETAQHHRTSSASFQESCKGGICLTGKTHNQKGQNCLAMSNCSCHLLFLDRGSLQRLPEQTFPEQMSPCWPENDFSG